MTTSLWVFGYGSLLWAPGFEFSASKAGVLKGFTRKFYQGNITHRGQPGKPGRVATLIEEKDAEVWGIAYEVLCPTALPYLDKRECKLGGYMTMFSEFFPSSGEAPFQALVYMATRDSCHWLGQASEQDIARQIFGSRGPSGHNIEYLLRLAEYQRAHAPEIVDNHLYGLESLVLQQIQEKGLLVQDFMGPSISEPTPTPREVTSEEETMTHQQFVPNVPEKQLRCLSI